MISRMAFLDGDKRSPASRANLVTGDQLGFDRRSIIARFDHAGTQMDRNVARRWTLQFDVKIRRHRAIRRVFAVAFHQEIRRRPIRMAV